MECHRESARRNNPRRVSIGGIHLFNSDHAAYINREIRELDRALERGQTNGI